MPFTLSKNYEIHVEVADYFIKNSNSEKLRRYNLQKPQF